MRNAFRTFLNWVLVILIIPSLAGCSLDIFHRNDIAEFTLKSDTAVIDVEDADTDFITITATAVTKGGSTVSPDTVWEYDEDVFTAVGTPTATLRLRLNLNGTGPNGKDITGYSVIKAWDASNSSIFDEVIVNVTGELQSIWFEDDDGNRISSITMNQKEKKTFDIATYPRAAQGFELIGEADPSNPDVAEIVVDSTAKTATITTGIPGTAKLSVMTADDRFTANLEVNVSEIELPDTVPSRIAIEQGDYISLSPDDSQKQLSAAVYDQYNQPMEADGGISWKSSDGDTVSVSGNGSRALIVPLKVGSATITASYDDAGLSASCFVTVGTELQDIIITPISQPAARAYRAMSAVTEREDSQSSSSIPVGKVSWYMASYLPAETDDTGVIWSVDNEDAVELDSVDGDIVSVKAVGSGTANLIATSSTNPDIASYVTISVYDPYIEPDHSISRIILEPISIEMEEGDSEVITATAVFHDGTEGLTDIIWSSDGSSAEIISTSEDSSEIIVEGNSPGMTTITATALSNPFVKSTAAVAVYDQGQLPGEALQRLVASPLSLTLIEGRTADIDISYLPPEAEKGIALPEVSGDSVRVTDYDSTSVTLEAISPGDTSITIISSSDPDIETIIKARVLTQEEAQRPSRISLSENAIEIEKGKSEIITADIYLIDGSIYNGHELIWKAEEGSEIVSVNPASGEASIEGLSEGNATIRVSLKDYPDISALLEILVYAEGGAPGTELQKIVPSQESLTLVEGDSADVHVSFLPSGTDETDVSWTITDGRIAYLESEGSSAVIEAIEAGETTVKVISSSKPSITASIRVKVITEEEAYSPSSIELSGSSFAIDVGESEYLTAFVYNPIDQEMTDARLSYEITKGEEYIEVHQEGHEFEIRGVGEGLSSLRIYPTGYESIYAEAEVIVRGEYTDPTVKLQGIIPSTEAISLVEGSSAEISISYIPANTYQKGLIWSAGSDAVELSEESDNKATVSGITATDAPVTVTITSSENPEISTEVSVRVIGKEDASRLINRIEIEPESLSIAAPYPTVPIEITAMSYDVAGNIIQDSYDWSVRQDSDVIKLSPSGSTAAITVNGPGTAVIKAVSRLDGNISASLTVDVEGALERLSITPSSLQVYRNGKATLKASLYPENTVEKALVWETVAGDGIERVRLQQNLSDRNRATITGLEAGNTQVRVYSELQPEIYAVCDIEVLPQELPDGTMPGSISLSPSTVTITPPFETQIVNATVYGDNGTVYPIGVDWSLENGTTVANEEPIATLSPTGDFGVRITPEMAGEATLTATSKVDDTVTASIPIIITGAIGSIEFVDLSQQLISVVVGDVEQVQVELSAADGGQTVETDIEWYQDGFIPIYDENGDLLGYDTDDDGNVDDDGSGMAIQLSPTQSGGIYGCSVKGIEDGVYTLVVRSIKRPEVSARLTVNVLPQEAITGKITLSPSSISLAPDDDRILITATIDTDEPYSFPDDTKIEMTTEANGLLVFSSPLWSQDGSVFTQYASPGNEPGEGYITVSLPEYPGIKTARGRVSIGGALTGFIPHNPEGDDDVLIISKGDVVSIGVDYVPDNTMEKGVIWTSESPDIVTVEPSEEGARAIISGVGVGTTKVIAESVHHPGINGVRYVFTVTVKPVVESVTFSYTNPSGQTSTGLTFNITDDTDVMDLRCNIFPDILQDAAKLMIVPHGDQTSGGNDLPSMTLINGTVNDYQFAPVKGVLGSYQYDIMQQSDGLSGEVIDVLTINVTTETTQLLIVDDSGQNFYSNSDIRYSFGKENPSTQFEIAILNDQLSEIANVEWKSSNVAVARVKDNGDNTATVSLRYPDNRDRCAGEAVITGTVGNGDAVVEYTVNVFVGIELPETLYEALYERTNLKNNVIFAEEKVFYPSMADSITSLDFSNWRSDSGEPLVLSDDEKSNWLNSDLFKNLEKLDISNCPLSTGTLNLSGSSKLRTLVAEQPETSEFHISTITGVPESMYEADLDNNTLSSLSSFRNSSLNTLSARNNWFSTFNDSTSLPASIRTLDLSDNARMTKLTIEQPEIQTVSANNCPSLDTLSAESRYLQSLSAYSCALTDVEISAACDGLETLDLHNNKLGEKASEVSIKGAVLKKSGSDYVDEDVIQTKLLEHPIMYGNELNLYKSSQGTGGNSHRREEITAYIGDAIPQGTIISVHQCGHEGSCYRQTGGIVGGETVLNYKAGHNHGLGVDMDPAANYEAKTTGDLAGDKVTFYTDISARNVFVNRATLRVYPFGK